MQIPRVETLNIVIELVLLCVFYENCQQQQQDSENGCTRGTEDVLGPRAVIPEQRVGDAMFVRHVPQF